MCGFFGDLVNFRAQNGSAAIIVRPVLVAVVAVVDLQDSWLSLGPKAGKGLRMPVIRY